MVTMKTLNGFCERLKKNGVHRLLALALVFLLALNILAVALPRGGFGDVSADSPYERECIITMEMEAGTCANLQLTLGSEPVLQDYPDPQKSLDELSFWVTFDGVLFDYLYDPYVSMSYTDGVLTMYIYSECDSYINIYPKDGTEVTALRLGNGRGLLPNGVTSLVLTNIDSLTTLDTSGIDELRELVLFALPSLTTVDASDCSLDEFVISDCAAITSLDVSSNSLTYGALPVPSSQYTSYSYASQSDMEAPYCVGAGDTIDLSECGLSTYTWYYSDGTLVTSGITSTGSIGVYTVGEELAGQTIYCVISNSNYSDLPSIKTTEIKVVDNLQFYYIGCKDSELSFTLADENAAFSVCADGNDITSSSTSYDIDSDYSYIYVSSESSVTDITLKGNNIEEVDVSHCTALGYLCICSAEDGKYIPLDSIDLSKNTELQILELTGTKVSEIDLSANTALKIANLANNRLGSATLPAGLESLSVNDNANISSLDFTEVCKSTLKNLKAQNCSLTSVDLSGFDSLIYLDLSHNAIANITIPENQYKYIDVSYNELTFETLPAYPLTITDTDFQYIYEQQAEVAINSTYNVGDTIDLSAAMKSSAADDVITATVYCGTEVYSSSTDSSFVIPEDLAGKEIYFKLSSNKFTDLVMSTNTAKINEVQEVIVSTSAAFLFDEAGAVSFSITSTAPVYVDWGGGTRTEYTPSDSDYTKPINISGTVVASNDIASIKIATTGDVTAADFSRDESGNEINIIALNIAQWDALETLDLSGNNLSVLDVTSNSDLSTLDISDNAFTFSTLPDFDGDGYVYSPQDTYSIKESFKVGETIDLTAVGAETYTWYNAETDSVVTPKTSDNGVFTFGSEREGLSLYCKMENSSWDGLEICTTATTITKADDDFDTASVTLKTSLASGTKATITVCGDDNVYIDWGNGVLVATVTSSTDCVTVEKAVLGDTVKIYTHGALTLLSATDMKITEADVSNAVDLETLDLPGNKLSSIDLSKNTALTTLDLSDNCFIFPNLPAVSSYTDYSYSPQALYTIPTVKGTGATLSTLTELTTSSGKMGYAWYKKNSSGEDTLLTQGDDNDYISLGSGKFSFNDSIAGETVYCVVTSTAYPDLSIRTTDMLILAGGGLAMKDTTGTVKGLTIAEGSTCKTTDGTTIPAGDLDGSASAEDAILTFKSKTFTDTSDITTSTLLSLVKSQLSTFDASDNCHQIYDFSFVDSTGTEITSFDGSVNITLSYPTAIASRYSEYDFYMFHYITSGTKKGTMESIAVTTASDGLTFTATSFSPYILVYQADPENDSEKNNVTSSTPSGTTSSTPDTGDHSEANARLASVILWISLIVMAVIAAVIIRKKHAVK